MARRGKYGVEKRLKELKKKKKREEKLKRKQMKRQGGTEVADDNPESTGERPAPAEEPGGGVADEHRDR